MVLVSFCSVYVLAHDGACKYTGQCFLFCFFLHLVGFWMCTSKVDFTYMFLNLLMFYNKRFVGLYNQKTYIVVQVESVSWNLVVCPSNFVLFINSFIDKIIDKTCQNIITMIYYIVAIIFLLLQNEPRKIKKKNELSYNL